MDIHPILQIVPKHQSISNGHVAAQINDIHIQNVIQYVQVNHMFSKSSG